MSEKRFEWDRTGIFDNKTNHFYYKTFDNEEVVDLLNEQQSKINELEGIILDLTNNTPVVMVKKEMSEKRFGWKIEKLQHSDDEVLMVVDNENKNWKGHILNIVDLLNEIAEENVFLRFEVSHLQKENEQLKEEVKQYWKYRDIRKQKVKDLEKQLIHIQNLIYKEKMQRDNDE